MRRRGRESPPPRGGFALPLVLAVGACALLLVLASASTTWRAYRGARQATAAARADMAAERGMAELVGDALRDSLAMRPLADTLRRRWIDGEGLTLSGVAVRPAPFVVWVAVTASEGGGGDPAAVRATRVRAERLAPPAWPIRAALTSTSPVDSLTESGAAAGAASGLASVIGTVGADPTDCFGGRHAGVPSVRQLPVDSVRAEWAVSWGAALARATPWRSDAPPDGRWRVQLLEARDSVLVGPRRWQGVLLHDGPLRLVGSIEGRGLLIVRGALDASAARLSISGAVLVDDPRSARVQLGTATLQWNRCAVSMALAALAVPRAAPFHTWVGLTP